VAQEKVLDEREVPVVDPSGHLATADLLSRRTADHGYLLEVQGPWGSTTAAADDLFEALTQVRRELEPRGWRILIQGARRDTYPSGMQRDQAAGRRVYVMRPGQPATLDDVRDTFAPADRTDVGSVAEQERAWQQWRAQDQGGGRR
jgi:hypothetical protein